MKYVGYDPSLTPLGVKSGRRFPWDHAVANPKERYIDLKVEPHRVEEALVDLAPCLSDPAAQATIALVRAINAPDSHFETSDFGFRCPRPNAAVHAMSWMNGFPYLVEGRLMFLYRDLRRNTSRDDIDSLARRLVHFLSNYASDAPVVVHFGLLRSEFAPLPGEPKGWELVASFWALGNDPREAITHYGVVVAALDEAFRRLNDAERATAD